MKSVTTNCDYVKWADVAEGSVIKGFFWETKKSAKYPSMNHYIETIEGKKFGLNGSANLDRALEQVRQGWYVEITYLGTTVLESGNFKGKDCHQFNVAYDDERIHPFFTGDASARKEVEYKNSAAAEQAAPAPTLVKPESVAAQAAPSAQPVAATQAAPKRSIF